MGKGWDHEVPGVKYWAECFRIARPGSFIIAMGGTRTFHRLTCAIEDAGFEIRDCILWPYGSGFPKSHNHFGLEGYGRALKPSWEPCVVDMKPCDKKKIQICLIKIYA
jgi:site-specific DNA-methyltransferase (adenine-specific)